MGNVLFLEPRCYRTQSCVLETANLQRNQALRGSQQSVGDVGIL